MTTYETAVAEFRSIDESIEAGQWRQAELTWEVTHTGVSQMQWVRDTGANRKHIQTLIYVWERHGRLGNPSVTFAEAYRMAETFADTPEAASAIKDANRAASALDKLGPIVKAGIIREHLADPDVAREVMSDHRARGQALTAAHKIQDEQERKLGQNRLERVERGERPDFERAIDVSALAGDLASVVMRTDRISGMMDRLTEHDRTLLAFAARRAQASVDYLAGLEGNASVDDELAELFGGEQA